jgi:hypothetical protein
MHREHWYTSWAAAFARHHGVRGNASVREVAEQCALQDSAGSTKSRSRLSGKMAAMSGPGAKREAEIVRGTSILFVA